MSTPVTFERDSQLLYFLRKEDEIAAALFKRRRKIARDLRKMTKAARSDFWKTFREQWPRAYHKVSIACI